MTPKKWGGVALAALLLACYNGAQPDLIRMRHNNALKPGTKKAERYGPSMVWLDRLMAGQSGSSDPAMREATKLNFNVMSSMMIAGLASGFKSQVANLLWMKADEYWHKGMMDRQVPLMEAVVTLDPQFIDAWSTAGWHWAYNIYADLPDRPDLKKLGKESPQLHAAQKRCVNIGLDYLKRGSEMNPETYRLWFEQAWTQSHKAGVLDEHVVELLRRSREQKDARDLEQSVTDAHGQAATKVVQGADIVGHTIGHVYEDIPEFDKALREYSILIANARRDNQAGKSPTAVGGHEIDQPLPAQEEALLTACGEYWARYGTDYVQIVNFYRDSDVIVKAQIKKLIPDIDRMVAAHAMREKMQVYESTATGAFITITARYMPAWKMMQAGKTQDAINTLLGVMNADTRYHLKSLPVLAKVLEIRGDAPAAIVPQLKSAREVEQGSSQEIGLHFLAKLYEQQAAQAQGAQKKALQQKEYETWVRSRERNTLDFYARTNSLNMEDEFGFKASPQLMAEIKKARKANGNVINVAPPPPNVGEFQQ